MNHGKIVYVVDARMKGKGERKFFDTLKEAEGWQQIQRVRRQNEGGRSFDDRELVAYGLTISDAIKFTLDHYRKHTASVQLEAAMNRLIEAKKGAGRSERYCNDLRLRLRRLCAAFDGKTVAQISTTDLEGFLAALNVSAGTRNTFRRDIRTIWSFAEKRGWADAKMAKNTERAKAIATPPGILTPEQAHRYWQNRKTTISSPSMPLAFLPDYAFRRSEPLRRGSRRGIHPRQRGDEQNTFPPACSHSR